MRLSYSAITTYEACPARFRFAYRDRVPGRPSPVLAFGDSIHRALYRFHDRAVPVAPSLGDLLAILDDVWVSDGFADRPEERLYRDHAREVLTRYHRDNADRYRIPAALEFRFEIDIEGVAVAGVIDRMDRLPGGGYEIIDYKTNRRLPPRSAVDRDLQLSIYALAAREVWGIEPERLTLYYLLPGHRMTTGRIARDLEDLRRRVRMIAERIEAGRFEPRENPLCRWCDYQGACPLFRHQLDRSPARIIETVDEWVRLTREEVRRSRRLDELGASIRAFAEEHGLGRVQGTEGAAQVVERSLGAPDPGAVRAALEPLGLWESVLAVDPERLGTLIEEGTLSPGVEDALLASRRTTGTTKALVLRDLEERARR